MIEAEFSFGTSDIQQMYILMGGVASRAYLLAGPDTFYRDEDGNITTDVWLGFRDERSYNSFTDWLYAWAEKEYAEVGDIRVLDEHGRLIKNHI